MRRYWRAIAAPAPQPSGEGTAAASRKMAMLLRFAKSAQPMELHQSGVRSDAAEVCVAAAKAEHEKSGPRLP